MADDDEKSNWTIKNVPVSVRKAALNAANKSDESAASWLSRAVANLANLEEGAEVYLPGQPGQRDPGQPANRAGITQELAVVDNPPLAHPLAVGQLDFAGLSQAMQAAVAACSASGVVLPKTVARGFVGLVNAELRRARGLPPPKPRRPRDSEPDEG